MGHHSPCTLGLPQTCPPQWLCRLGGELHLLWPSRAFPTMPCTEPTCTSVPLLGAWCGTCAGTGKASHLRAQPVKPKGF